MVTDNDLDMVVVTLDQLPGQSQATYGCASEQVEKQKYLFLNIKDVYRRQ